MVDRVGICLPYHSFFKQLIKHNVEVNMVEGNDMYKSSFRRFVKDLLSRRCSTEVIVRRVEFFLRVSTTHNMADIKVICNDVQNAVVRVRGY